MKKVILLVLTFITLPLLALAEDKKEPEPDCNKFESEIRSRIAGIGACWENSECQVYNFGCPWEMVPCQFSIISTTDSENTDVVKKQIEHFEKKCLMKDKEMQAKCDAYKNSVKKKECGNPPKLICLSGKCVTETHVIMEGGKGVDIYGSRAVIGEPTKEEIENERKAKEADKKEKKK